jgi:hypothetical protein
MVVGEVVALVTASACSKTLCPFSQTRSCLAESAAQATSTITAATARGRRSLGRTDTESRSPKTTVTAIPIIGR